MKILPAFDVFRYLNNVREKPDGQGHGSGGQQQHKKEEKPSEETEYDRVAHGAVDADQMNEAIGSFQNDSQAQANGLNAAVEGNGPGLKVVLRGGDGSVVRQFTGEEFLKLREAVSKDGRSRGKILDRKL